MRSAYDPCVYMRKLDDGSLICLVLYVNDMLITAKNIDEIDKMKLKLNAKFETKDIGSAKEILGIEIVRDRREMITLSH